MRSIRGHQICPLYTSVELMVDFVEFTFWQNIVASVNALGG